jgi:hypothetical protein
MMPFPDLELVRTRIEDLNRRAERERLVNQALASRPRRERLRSALSFARSVFHRARTGVRLAASNDEIAPELEPLLRVAAEQRVDRADGVRDPVSGSEHTLSRNISREHSRDLLALGIRDQEGPSLLTSPTTSRDGVRQR